VAEGRVTALLEATRLHLRHPRAERDSLRDVSLGVGRGEIVALVGPNGSGKSTLLAALGRVLRPRSGGVRLDGVDAWRIPRRRFARRVARLPQAPLCPEGLRVEELVQSGRNPHGRRFGPRTREDRDAVERALRALDLVDQRRRPVETLSGGERRRAFLAMVLCQEAEAVLLDEPTAALDLRHQLEMLDWIARRNRDEGTTFLISLHDLETAATISHRVAVLHRGRLYAHGPAERCLREDGLRDVFGVEARVEKRDGALRIELRGPADPIRSL
jgi:iron complex transport system ATP-binding protein